MPGGMGDCCDLTESPESIDWSLSNSGCDSYGSLALKLKGYGFIVHFTGSVHAELVVDSFSPVFGNL